ncbi:MAG: methenyltetrahydromethanopterin cyclohydrolase [Promethearchaeota archaeon]
MVSESDDISVNQRALSLLLSFRPQFEIYGIIEEELQNGAKIYNFTNANMDGAILLSKICMGDLAEIIESPIKASVKSQDGQYDLNMLEVRTDEPVIACMGSQYAGWGVKVKKVVDGKKKTHFKCMGSGPARALSRVEKELFEKIKYADNFDSAVLILETANKPDELVAEYVAKKCNVDVDHVHLLYAPTASLAGSVQIAARIVETSIHKFLEVGLDPSWLVSGKGICPIAPVAKDDFKAMGWTNDCIIFMGSVTLTMDVKSEDEKKLVELLKKVPSNTSPSYGKPFLKVFEEANGDFYKIDPGMFAPAKVTVINRITSNIFTEGDLNPDVLDFSA